MGDVVYAFSCSGIVFAFDAMTGDVRWTYNTEVEDGLKASFHGEPVVTDQWLLVASDAGWVYAFELATGNIRWKSMVGPAGVYSDLIRMGSQITGSSSRGGFFAVELETGKLSWKIEPDRQGSAMSLSSPVRVGDSVFFADFGSSVSRVAIETGEVDWTRDLDAELTTDLATVEGDLVVGLADRRLVRIDPATGGIKAEIELPVEVKGTPVLAGTALIVADYSSFLHAVESDLSAVRWSQAGRWSSDRVLVEDETIVAGTTAGELTALRLETGEQVWSATVEGVIRGIGGRRGTYFAGVQAGTIYAYQPDWRPAPLRLLRRPVQLK